MIMEKYYRKNSEHGWTVFWTKKNSRRIESEQISLKHILWDEPMVFLFENFQRLRTGGVVLPTRVYHTSPVESSGVLETGFRNKTVAYNMARASAFRDLEGAVATWIGDVEAKWAKLTESGLPKKIAERQAAKKKVVVARRKKDKQRTITRRS